MNQEEFEQSIEGDYSESRWEFAFTTIEPYWGGGGYDHYIKIAPRFVEQAEEIVDGLSDRLQAMVKIERQTYRQKFSFPRSTFETDRFIALGHSADRKSAGYANIYRAIKSLAPYAEDSWFLMWDEDTGFSDEYRIVDGNLLFVRHEHAGEYYNREKMLLPIHSDKVWRDSIARREVLTLSHPIERGIELERVNEVLDWCESFTTEVPSVLYFRALYHRHRGNENACLSMLSQIEELPGIAFDLSLSLLSEGDLAGAKSQLQKTLKVEPERLLAKLLFHWLDKSLLQGPFSFSSAFAEDADMVMRLGLFPGLMEYLHNYHASQFSGLWLRLAEYFRIKVCHDVQREFASRNAELCYEKAIEAAPEDGDIYLRYALFCEQNNAPEQEKTLLEKSAALGSTEALSTLAARSFRKGDFSDAQRYFTEWEIAQDGKPLSGYGSSLTPHYFLQTCVELGHLALTGPTKALSKAKSFFAEGSRIQKQYELQSEGVFNGLATLAYLWGEHDESLAFAHEMIEQLNSEYGWSMKASALNNLGRYDEALEACEVAQKRNDDYWHHYYVRACVLAHQKDLAGAIENLEEAWYRNSECVTENVAREEDFDGLRAEPAFVACLRGMK